MHPIYVVSGDNKIRINECVEELIKESTEEYDLISFDLEDSSLATLLDELNTIPFLYPSKIVILKNPVVLYTPSKYNEKLVEAFSKYLNKPSSSTTLIILIKSIKDIDKTFTSDIKNNAIIKEIVSPTDVNLTEYIESSFKNDGYTFDSNVVEEIIERTKGNVNRVEIELTKLKTYKYDDKKILRKDVKTLVSKELDDNIFDLINAVVDNDIPKSMSIFNDLMTLNVSETTIIALLISKFNELYDTKTLADAGYTKNDIADLFHVKPGRIYYLQKALNGISAKTLKNNINYLTDLDYKIKTGLIDKRLGLELFLLKN